MATLPTDYATRIVNFLSDYLGTPDRPTPFGGRKTDLDRLDAWLDDLTQPPRLLLAAPAGRGKSALLVHWAQALIERENLAVVFIPVSIRFKTNLGSVVFAALAARLAKLHGEAISTTVDIAGEMWRGKATDLLRYSLPYNRRLIVILDGVDEAADWKAGPDLFPYALPPGIRVVVSARYLANDSDAAAWRRRLGWDSNGRAQDMDLPGLTREGVADVLRSVGIPPDSASEPTIVAELHRLSEGDPLLVRLYVDELYSPEEAAAPRLRPADLHGLQPGLKAFFERWFDEQHSLWGNEAPLKEKAVQAVLELLACALGPLRREDILNELAPATGDLTSWTLDEALRPLARLVLGDGEKQDYVFSHPRLGIFFKERLGSNERRAVTDRFLNWGANTLAALNEERLAPRWVSPYLLQYYRAHLEGAKRAVDAFLPLISDGWARAWFGLEGGYAGFLTDIERVSQVAAQTNAQAARRGQPVPYLGAEIRCALCQASISSLASRFPPELLAALVRHRVVDEGRALDYALQNPDEKMRSAALVTLSPALLSDHARDRALEAASSFQDNQCRIQALSALAPTLSPIQRDVVLGIATQITDNFWRGRLLEALVPHLPLVQLDHARELAEEMSPSRAINFPKEDTLATVVQRYAELDRIDFAFKVLKSLDPPHCWIKAASGAISFLPEDQRNALLQDALQTVRDIRDPFYRAEAYIALAPCLRFLDEDERLARFLEARGAARRLHKDHMTVLWLTALIPYLPPRVQNRALDYASKLLERVDDDYFSDPLAPRLALSKHYAQLGAVDKALKVVTTRTGAISGLLGMAALVRHLPESARAAVVAKCEKQAEALDTYSRLRVIGLLADDIPAVRRHEVLTDARTNVLRIGDREDCRKAIFLVAPVLAEFGDLAKARDIALATVGSPRVRASALMRIGAASSSDDERRTVLKEALHAAFSIGTEDVQVWDRNDSLAAVAPRLAEAGCIDDAIDAIRHISDGYSASEAWAKTLPYIATHDVTRAWHVYGELTSVSNAYLVALIPYLTGPELDGAVLRARHLWFGDDAKLAAVARLAALGNLDVALTEAKAIEHPRVRLNALLEVVSCLPACDPRYVSALAEAHEAVEQIDSVAAKAQAFIKIAQNVAESERGDLVELAEKLALEAISQDSFGADAVMPFVDEFRDRDRLIAEALHVVLEEAPSTLSIDLINHLSYPMLEEADRAVVQAVENDYDRDEIRSHIVVRLAHLGFGAEALSRIGALTRREFIAEALARIGGYLDPAVLAKAVETQPQRFAADQSGELAKALAGLAEHLSGPALAQAIDAACTISRNDHRETALTALADRIRSIPAEALYPLWRQRMLPVLAKRTREAFVSDLAALAPAIGRLAGSDALTDICEGIEDVTQWWP